MSVIKSTKKKAPLPPGIKEQLAAGEFDAIEETWLVRVEEDPTELDYFIPIARALDKAGGESTVSFLLEMLDEQLVENEDWPLRLQLLERAGLLFVEPEEIHKTILSCLKKIHGELPSYDALVEKVGLFKAMDDIPKTWKKVERLVSLIGFDQGAIVVMEGKGAGRVVEVNMTLESFKIEFESGLELRVGFGGAAKLLEPLLPGHILYIKMKDSKRLEKLRDEKPGELLQLVLESYEGPRIGAEIKRDLVGVVSESGWNRWWTAARKHPQVLAAAGTKRAYTWAASSEDAQDVVWEAFEEGDLRARMDLLRRDAQRDPALKRRMSLSLARSGAEVASSQPGLACEIWFHLEKSGELPNSVEWSPQTLIPSLEDPREIFTKIRDRTMRERAYEIAYEKRSDWADLLSDLAWYEQDSRALDFLSRLLTEAGRFDSFFGQLVSAPRKNPAAFTWLAERAGDNPEWMAKNPTRLLQQILFALNSGDFATYRAARLVPLTESGGTIPRILGYLSEEQAPQALAAVERAPGLESYQREPLVNAILLRFPDLRNEEDTTLYATSEMIITKRAELKNLAEVELPANRSAIEEAREMGDLRENFEYKAARQRHEYLSARATQMKQDLDRARPIDSSQVKGNEVVIGCRVRLVSDNVAERTITILGPWESEPEKDILSNESEFAQKLLGTALGAQVKVGGETWRVDSVEPWE
jgi:transcription elongation GreA/GreB family factor